MCECSACITWNRSVSFGFASRSLRIFRSPLLTRLPNCCDAPLFRSTMFKCIGHVLDSFTLFDHTRACVQCTSTFVHTHQSPVRSMEILNAKWVVTRNQEHTLKKKRRADNNTMQNRERATTRKTANHGWKLLHYDRCRWPQCNSQQQQWACECTRNNQMRCTLYVYISWLTDENAIIEWQQYSSSSSIG